jgi:hypothetical protein
VSEADSDSPRRSKMPSPIQIAIAIGLYDVIHMEAPVELGYEQRSASALGSE